MPGVFARCEKSRNAKSSKPNCTELAGRMSMGPGFRCFSGNEDPESSEASDILSFDTSFNETSYADTSFVDTYEENCADADRFLQERLLTSVEMLHVDDKTDEFDEVDPDVERALKKSVMHEGFEKGLGEGYDVKSRNQALRERKEDRSKTAGSNWFDMEAAEMTEEKKRDLEIVQMRAQLDPTNRYRKSDRNVLPKFFQVGRVVEHKADFYSSRLTNSERRNTIAGELLADQEFQTKNRKRYEEVMFQEGQLKRQVNRKLQSRTRRTSRKKNAAA